MHSDVRISPSILSADFMNMERDIEAITMGGADLIHVDVMDGHFVPNLTIGAPVVEGLSHVARIPLDVHLMVSNPLEQLPWFLKHAPYLVTVHAEALDAEAGEFSQAIDAIHAAGSKACIALRPDTDDAEEDSRGGEEDGASHLLGEGAAQDDADGHREPEQLDLERALVVGVASSAAASPGTAMAQSAEE